MTNSQTTTTADMSSSVVSLEDRKARRLTEVRYCYVVGRRHMLSEMTEEQQAKIRDVYDETGFVNENAYSLELFEVCTELSDAIAEASRHKDGFWMELPVGAPLGEELKRYLPEGHPGSRSEAWYEKTSPGTEIVIRRDIVQMASMFTRLRQLAETP